MAIHCFRNKIKCNEQIRENRNFSKILPPLLQQPGYENAQECSTSLALTAMSASVGYCTTQVVAQHLTRTTHQEGKGHDVLFGHV